MAEQIKKTKKIASNSMLSKKKQSNKATRKDNRDLFLLSLPGMVKVFIFSYIPLFFLSIAFLDYKPRRGVFGSKWNNFANFQYLLKSDTALRCISNAMVINVLGIIFGTIVSVILGLFLYEITKKIFLKISQTVVIFPYFVSWPLVAILLGTFLDYRTGMLTTIVNQMFGTSVNPYEDPSLWWGIITFCSVWKTSGLSAVTYYAVLMTSDKSVYEAAKIDGASRFQTMLHVGLPSLALMIVLNVIMSSANIIRVDFNMVYYLTRAEQPLFSTTDVIETFMYRSISLNTSNPKSYLIPSAIGLIQAVVGFVLTLIVNKVCQKISKTSLF